MTATPRARRLDWARFVVRTRGSSLIASADRLTPLEWWAALLDLELVHPTTDGALDVYARTTDGVLQPAHWRVSLHHALARFRLPGGSSVDAPRWDVVHAARLRLARALFAERQDEIEEMGRDPQVTPLAWWRLLFELGLACARPNGIIDIYLRPGRNSIEVGHRVKSGVKVDWAAFRVRRQVSRARLIWEDMHGPPPKGTRIRHLDGDRGNCDPNNLELVEDLREVGLPDDASGREVFDLLLRQKRLRLRSGRVCLVGSHTNSSKRLRLMVVRGEDYYVLQADRQRHTIQAARLEDLVSQADLVPPAHPGRALEGTAEQ